MITSKQRRYLKGLAQEIFPSVYIGKQGLTENIYKEMETGFRVRGLVKVKIQEGSDLDPKDVANKLAQDMDAEFVQAIGRKFVLYKESEEDKKIELPR